MAAQRPPGQAWFRLPTMRPPAPATAPPPAPAPAPAPAPPPAVVRPAIPIRPSTQPQVPPAATSQPPSPPPKSPVAPPAASPAPPPPPLSSSPMITKEAITTTSTNTQQKPSPSPQKIAQAPSSTSNGRGPSSRPPSPLQLPPAQIKPSEEAAVEQKSVLVQESNEKQPLKTSNALAHNYSSKGKRDTPTKDKKQNSDSEDLGMRIITIAGENRGALMEISSSHKKSSNGYTLEKGKIGKGEEGQCDDESQPTTTFLNSNVQGVNNSIVYNSSCSHNDPGIHLSLVRKSNGNNGQNHHHHG